MHARSASCFVVIHAQWRMSSIRSGMSSILAASRSHALQHKPTRLVVPREQLLPLYEAVRATTAEQLKELGKSRPEEVSAGDWQEGRFTAWPISKAHIVVITGSIRNLQKLVKDMDATGKEAEFCTALWKMNKTLHALLPDMFEPSESYSYSPPMELAEGQRAREEI